MQEGDFMKLLFQNLDTSRLTLRKLMIEDIEDLFIVRSNEEMNLFIDNVTDTSIEQTKKYIETMNFGLADSKWLIWGIVDNESSKLIGTISLWNFHDDPLSCELGYGILPSYQRRGLMSEAIQKIVQYAFNTMPIRYISAFTEEKNIPSIELLKKCGFRYVDTIEEIGYKKPQVFRMHIFRAYAND
jgi:ribosomal-protein-alanine N-acetyltransferase